MPSARDGRPRPSAVARPASTRRLAARHRRGGPYRPAAVRRAAPRRSRQGCRASSWARLVTASVVEPVWPREVAHRRPRSTSDAAALVGGLPRHRPGRPVAGPPPQWVDGDRDATRRLERPTGPDRRRSKPSASSSSARRSGSGRRGREPLEDRAVGGAGSHRRRPLDQEGQRAVVRPGADVADAPLEQLAVGGAARPGDRRVGLEPGRLQRRTGPVEVVDRDGPRDRAACRADPVEPRVGLVRTGRDQLDVGRCGSADEHVLGADGVRSPALGGGRRHATAPPPRRGPRRRRRGGRSALPCLTG